MLPIKPFIFLLCLLFVSGSSFCQWSPDPVINDFGGEALDTLFLSDSTFCKGSVLTIGGDHFLNVSIAEIWDSLSVLIGPYPCEIVYLDSTRVEVAIPNVIINDTCMPLTLIKYTHSLFGTHSYPAMDTVCLIGDVATVIYPDSIFCLGDTNPRPLVTLSPSTSGSFCCWNGPSGFLVLPDGTIPIHSGAVGNNTSFQFITTHPVCPETLTFSIDILPVSDASFTLDTFQVCSNTDSVWINATNTGDLAALFSDSVIFNSAGGNTVPVNGVLGGGTTYEIRHIVGGSCPDTVIQPLTVIEQDDPSFVYNPSFYCLGDPDPLPQILGLGGGVFSAVDTATVVAPDGRLNLQASGPGNHTVQYFTVGNCPDSAVFTVTVNNSVSAYFTYSSSFFCESDSNPLPTVNTPGGVFSSGAGLALDSLNGMIDIGTSQPGIYLIEYSFNGSCQTTFSQTINIQPIDTLTSIDYGTGPFCKDSLPVIPQLTGDSIGNFLVSGGAVFFSPYNGAIDLGASPVGGPYFITYDILNSCARDVTDTIYITEAPNVVLAYPFSYACLGDAPVFLDPIQSALHAGVFSYSSGLVGDSAGTVFPNLSQTGNHQISYTTTGNCPVRVVESFQINPMPSNAGMTIFPNDTVCEGELIRGSLSGSDAVAYGFLINGEVADSSFFIFESDTFNNGDQFTGYIRNAYGCTDSFSNHLTLSPKPTADITIPGDIVTGDKSWVGLTADLDSTLLDYWIVVSGDSTPGDIILGMAGEESPLLVRTGRERYDPAKVQVMIVPKYGHCLGDTTWADYLVIENQFFVPEVITPNGDGKNDTWKVSWEPETDPFDYELLLFNRSGGEVFKMSPLHKGFDGGSLPDGVYWWTLNRFDGKQIQSGGLTIHR